MSKLPKWLKIVLVSISVLLNALGGTSIIPPAIDIPKLVK